MNYTDCSIDVQDDHTPRALSFVKPTDLSKGVLINYSGMPDFIQESMPEYEYQYVNYGSSKKPIKKAIPVSIYKGRLRFSLSEADLVCPLCGSKLHKNDTQITSLRHIPAGSTYQKIEVRRNRYRCSKNGCNYTYSEKMDFKAKDHLITVSLLNFVVDLLKQGISLKQISLLTGLNQNIVKDIDKKRLLGIYTENGEGKKLIKPEKKAEMLGIDEFLLHADYNFATIIIDMSNGHVLWLAHGKKKQTVYDFINHVGIEWMKAVKVVACDMNSDYEEAFKDECPWISIVFDHFHIVKNLNEKVISEIRKEEQNRLKAEGLEDEAKYLKGSRYILMTSDKTRKKKEKDARNDKVISKGNELFNKPEKKARAGIKKEYQELIKQNELFVIIDIIKELLEKAYSAKSKRAMKIYINKIIRLANASENKHLEWFAKLLRNHYDGIITYADYHITSGKVEGTNNMIKTVRRQAYGYNDDGYFFLKIMDASRKDINLC